MILFSVQRRSGLFWVVEGVSGASDTLCFNTFVYQFQLQYKYQEHEKFKSFCLFPRFLPESTLEESSSG